MYNPTNNTPENNQVVSVPLKDSTDFYDTMDQLIATLPDEIKCIVDLFKSKEEKVVALCSSIVLSGTCFPNIKVNYHKRTYYLSLMLVIEGPPASGKGALSEVRKMLRKINEKFRKEYALENSKYKAALTAY